MYVTKHFYSGSQVSNTQIYQFTFATVNRELNNYCTQLCFIYGMQQIPIIPISIYTIHTLQRFNNITLTYMFTTERKKKNITSWSAARKSSRLNSREERKLSMASSSAVCAPELSSNTAVTVTNQQHHMMFNTLSHVVYYCERRVLTCAFCLLEHAYASYAVVEMTNASQQAVVWKKCVQRMNCLSPTQQEVGQSGSNWVSVEKKDSASRKDDVCVHVCMYVWVQLSCLCFWWINMNDSVLKSGAILLFGYQELSEWITFNVCLCAKICATDWR